jgi:6-phosphogluconolactonase (cycloisomerase 2 family)
MKFKKFGKALLMSALSAGVILSVTSCVQSYTAGYLYVTGTVASESDGNGYVAGFKIDHNTGKLTPINGLNPPVASGGANPVRALLLGGGRFLYVLNQGVSNNPAGSLICSTEYPCQNSNISQFAVGANGVLTFQEQFQTQGKNPFRMVADTSGNFLYVLDHDAPDNYSGATGIANACTQALGNDASGNPITTCGDITAFSINSTTGRLSLVPNAQVKVTTTAAGTQNLTYFPVPVNPIDFAYTGGSILTLTGTPATGDSVYPYAYSSSNGQLGVTLNSSDSIGDVHQATAIVYSGSYTWVLDNEPITVTVNGATTTSPSQILPWIVSATGSMTALSSGPIADDPNQSNPVYLAVESKGKWFYVANQGTLAPSTLALSGVAGYVENSPFLPNEMGGTPIGFGAGAGPVCLVEDPSNQFFYTANIESQTVTGQMLDQNAGTLTPLSQSSKVSSSYALSGPPTWCLVDGRISN